ncbi:MAG: MFS transporter [Pseudomonadota bacterium]|nr:MFS transporter [Pseudomonadota bacterium]MEC8501128.1 MFS transporter [Pseudomonadota bacterium]MEC8696610.1 MFS transporter [Pseudomonadota bacterium]
MSVKNNPHGWAIVGLTLLMQTVSSGLGFYNMSVYINRLSAQLAVSSADTSFAVSLFFVVGGVAGLYVADLLRVWSVRKVVIAGALVSGVAVALVGFADQLWQVYALFTLFGIGNAGISIVISTTLITRWFPGPERSMALAVGSTGLSLGGFLITPLTAYVMNGWGFDLTMHWLGVFLVLSVVPIALFLRFPSNEESSAHNAADTGQLSAQLAVSLAAALRSRFYILLAVAYVLIMGSQVGSIAHLYSRVELLGDFTMAALAVQALSIASITGRFIGGWLVSWMPIRRFALGNLLLQSVGLLLIAFAPNSVMGVVAAGIFGLSVGNLLMTQPLWLAEKYSVDIYPQVFARANAISVLGVAAGPFCMGWIFDYAGSYTFAFICALATSLVAFVVVWMASIGPASSPQS